MRVREPACLCGPGARGRARQVSNIAELARGTAAAASPSPPAQLAVASQRRCCPPIARWPWVDGPGSRHRPPTARSGACRLDSRPAQAGAAWHERGPCCNMQGAAPAPCVQACRRCSWICGWGRPPPPPAPLLAGAAAPGGRLAGGGALAQRRRRDAWSVGAPAARAGRRPQQRGRGVAAARAPWSPRRRRRRRRRCCCCRSGAGRPRPSLCCSCCQARLLAAAAGWVHLLAAVMLWSHGMSGQATGGKARSAQRRRGPNKTRAAQCQAAGPAKRCGRARAARQSAKTLLATPAPHRRPAPST
jgi:hypothetical protein